MHINFYHWHGRVELKMKPDSAVLETRWNAAIKFVEKLSPADLCALLRYVLFAQSEPEFSKRFTEGLMKIDPTFPATGNMELLRVMAAAGTYSILESPSNAADSLALGLHAANFPTGRVDPVCQEVMDQAAKYLINESERIRPKIYVSVLADSEKKVEVSFAAFKKAIDADSVTDIAKATEIFGRGVLGAMKESHKQLGDVISRMAEESQFLWWLVGKRSNTLNLSRNDLTAQAYAFPAAREAADRVNALPPTASIESLISEVLGQCNGSEKASWTLLELCAVPTIEWIQNCSQISPCPEITPLTTILAARLHNHKPTAELLKGLNIPSKSKFTPSDIARQFFRELIFVRSLDSVN